MRTPWTPQSSWLLRKPDLHVDLVTLLTVFNDYWLMSCALPETAAAAEEADA